MNAASRKVQKVYMLPLHTLAIEVPAAEIAFCLRASRIPGRVRLGVPAAVK